MTIPKQEEKNAKECRTQCRHFLVLITVQLRKDMNAEVNCLNLNCLIYCGLQARDTKNTVLFIYLSYGQHVDMRRVRRCLPPQTQTYNFGCGVESWPRSAADRHVCRCCRFLQVFICNNVTNAFRSPFSPRFLCNTKSAKRFLYRYNGHCSCRILKLSYQRASAAKQTIHYSTARAT